MLGWLSKIAENGPYSENGQNRDFEVP
jgi:hypothetical protein